MISEGRVQTKMTQMTQVQRNLMASITANGWDSLIDLLLPKTIKRPDLAYFIHTTLS